VVAPVLRIRPWAQALCCCGAILALPGAAPAGEHPRLLIQATDVPELRHACGIGQPLPAAHAKFGRSAADYQALRDYFKHTLGQDALTGERLALAFLHLLTPNDPAGPARIDSLNRSLRDGGWLAEQTLESVLVLDWCWSSLAPDARRSFMYDVRERAAPLGRSDSPLKPAVFRQKLAALALAIAVDETDDPNPSWHLLRRTLLSGAQKYFTQTFPRYLEWRGPSPTGSAVAAEEETLTALACELAATAFDDNSWQQHSAVGRWLEHYLLDYYPQPQYDHGFVHAEGNTAPNTPADGLEGLAPLAAHLIAARTKDPAATRVAQLVTAQLHSRASLLGGVWRWVPIVYSIDGQPATNLDDLPAARNLGGSVVFRGGSAPDPTVIWIDAAQPFLRRRQHFDAGHFMIRRAGELVIDGARDVSFQAVRAKGGGQHLGRQKEPFNYEQYLTASIAHNCLLFWDAARVQDWYGQRYLPAGGQRPIENTCEDFNEALHLQERQTGRQLAYGQRDGMAYLALDLKPAYERRAVTAYTREFIFVLDHALVVVDRGNLVYSRSPATFAMQLPTRPLVDGYELTDRNRVRGDTNAGGIWRYDTARWLRWTQGDGGLWFQSLVPDTRVLRVIGGPAKERKVKLKDGSKRSYVGGAADSFERLAVPAERHGAQNVWYRLGEDAHLDDDFGRIPHWGRIEIEPVARDNAFIFITVLITDTARIGEVPKATLEAAGDGYTLELAVHGAVATISLPGGLERGGEVRVPGRRPGITAGEGVPWQLPTDIAKEGPLE
jgi:hypothetical protein